MPAARRDDNEPPLVTGGSGVQSTENIGRQNVISVYRRMLCETTDPVERQCIIELMTEEIGRRLPTGV
jgi:hypothetical protein